MSYKEIQRSKAIQFRNTLFTDLGQGIYRGECREFVLKDSKLNLWAGIREDAIDYYARNKISWWESGSAPTGHLLSSQIACLNHLYFIRQRKDLATKILQAIEPGIKSAEIIDDGYVEFEKVGLKNLGKELGLTRGANCTSVDAIMLGSKNNGERILFFIEWKYTESYSQESKLNGDSGLTRQEAYKDLLNDPLCPIKINNTDDLYYEPFYQLMRQTLLAWEMTKRNEYGAVDWVHLHIIPTDNFELRNKITSPGMSGNNIEQAWKAVLKDPSKYISLSPEQFLLPVQDEPDTKSLLTYLKDRYWI
jgi:hypothetical protein